jgi:parvulin-like peptidyl-prolyl isomerase
LQQLANQQPVTGIVFDVENSRHVVAAIYSLDCLIVPGDGRRFGTPMRRSSSGYFVASIGSVLLTSACSSLTSPPETEVEPKLVPAATVTAAPTTPPPVVPAAAPEPPPPPPEEQIRASHILVAYKGAHGSSTTPRTKEQAKRRAEEIAKKARGGAAFAALAKQYSDDPGSGPRGGNLGSFARLQMVKPFADAAFALSPNEVSGVVESEFGFHIIKRNP